MGKVTIPLDGTATMSVVVNERIPVDESRANLFARSQNICALLTASRKATELADNNGHAVFEVYCAVCKSHLFIETDIPTT